MEHIMLENLPTLTSRLHMRDILSTFQKHIGTQFEGDMQTQTPSIASIHRFGEDMKGANEFIGALQSASSMLRKILKTAQSIDSQSQSIHITKAESEIIEMVENASFMGVKLFDTQLGTRLNGAEYTITFESPLPLLASPSHTLQSGNTHPFQALISYVEEKAFEASQMLLDLSDALTAPLSPNQSRSHSFDTFSPSQFTQMLKGQ